MIKEKIKNFTIIDTHLHLGYLSGLNIPQAPDGQIMEQFKKYGVKKAIFSHHAALSSMDYGLARTIEALERYKGMLYAYLVFNPNFAKKSLEIIQEYIKHEAVAGVKIHPSWHACYPYDERYARFWKYADSKGIVVLTHTWNPNVPNKSQKFSDPVFFEKIANNYPDAKIILAHAGGRGNYFYKVMELIEKNENLYVDFAGDIFEPFLIKSYVDRLGSERLLFGTDLPWVDMRYYLSNILNAQITDTERENIFGLNALRLFGAKISSS
jgi:uncharacterized protein